MVKPGGFGLAKGSYEALFGGAPKICQEVLFVLSLSS